MIKTYSIVWGIFGCASMVVGMAHAMQPVDSRIAKRNHAISCLLEDVKARLGKPTLDPKLEQEYTIALNDYCAVRETLESMCTDLAVVTKQDWYMKLCSRKRANERNFKTPSDIQRGIQLMHTAMDNLTTTIASITTINEHRLAKCKTRYDRDMANIVRRMKVSSLLQDRIDQHASRLYSSRDAAVAGRYVTYHETFRERYMPCLATFDEERVRGRARASAALWHHDQQLYSRVKALIEQAQKKRAEFVLVRA